MRSIVYNSFMGSKLKMKRSTIFSSIITLISFGYKLVLAILTASNVLVVAATSTFLVFMCKVLFIRNITMSRERKKKAYLFMTILILLFSLIFLLFTVLKAFGIDASNQKSYEGLVGALLIAFMVVMFILSVINLKGALEKTDIMVIGLKEMVFVSALADLVIIEEYVYRMFIDKNIEIFQTITRYFPLAMAGLMLVVTVIMFIRFARYKVDNK